MTSIGPSPEMYLKSLYELSPGPDRVQVSSVAARLGVSPVSASEMIHRLVDRRMVDYRRYRGARLTGSGRQVARSLIRRHRLWESFLFDHLGLAWEDVHDLACELEHAAPDAVTDSLAERLGHPAACPHGNPIPAAGEPLPQAPGRSLAELGEGDRGRLLAVHPESAENLAYLAQHGFLPGTRFLVERIEPTDDLRLLRWESGTMTVGTGLAAQLHVERLPAEDG